MQLCMNRMSVMQAKAMLYRQTNGWTAMFLCDILLHWRQITEQRSATPERQNPNNLPYLYHGPCSRTRVAPTPWGWPPPYIPAPPFWVAPSPGLLLPAWPATIPGPHLAYSPTSRGPVPRCFAAATSPSGTLCSARGNTLAGNSTGSGSTNHAGSHYR